MEKLLKRIKIYQVMIFHDLCKRRFLLRNLLTAVIFSILFFTYVSGAFASIVNFITSTSQTTWTVPSDWNSSNNTIEVIGGGAGADPDGDNGGGGGGYSKATNVTLTPGTVVGIAVGSGGVGTQWVGSSNCTPGGDTYLCKDNNLTSGHCTDSSNLASTQSAGWGTSVVVGAKGGDGSVACNGGSASYAYPSTSAPFAYSGGNGGSAPSAGAGGGGGAAGPNGNGGTGGEQACQQGGAGGGGNGGGGPGSANSCSDDTGGSGGHGYGGSGGGAAGAIGGPGGNATAGTGGGGGGGGGSETITQEGVGGNGATGGEWGLGLGSGGGGGGGGSSDGAPGIGNDCGNGGNGGLYGGASGGSGNASLCYSGNGAQGIIVITYTSMAGTVIQNSTIHNVTVQ